MMTTEEAKAAVTRAHELQWRLIYACIVAGKSAKFADAKMAILFPGEFGKTEELPFDLLRTWNTGGYLSTKLKEAKTGNYAKLTRCFTELTLGGGGFDLETCTPAMLEKVHGIGPKTSRFFIMWVRPTEVYAALDVHVLRWLRNNGYPDAPASTPNGAKYLKWEQVFLAEAKKRGKTPRELDFEIWSAGSGTREMFKHRPEFIR